MNALPIIDPPTRAWLLYAELRSAKAAGAAMGVSDRTIYRLMDAYRAAHPGAVKPPRAPPPSTVQPDADAWEAWGIHGTQGKAAQALGIHRNVLLYRVNRYRKRHGLDPRAVPPTANGHRAGVLKRQEMKRQRHARLREIHARTGSASETARVAGCSRRTVSEALGGVSVLDRLLATLEAAQAAGDVGGEKDARAMMHAIERRMYGVGVGS